MGVVVSSGQLLDRQLCGDEPYTCKSNHIVHIPINPIPLYFMSFEMIKHPIEDEAEGFGTRGKDQVLRRGVLVAAGEWEFHPLPEMRDRG